MIKFCIIIFAISIFSFGIGVCCGLYGICDQLGIEFEQIVKLNSSRLSNKSKCSSGNCGISRGLITCHKKHLIARCSERGYDISEVMPCIVFQNGDEWTVDVDHPKYPREPKIT